MDPGICHLQLMDFWEPQGVCKKVRCCEALPATIPMAVVFLERNFHVLSSSGGAVLTAHLCLFHLAQGAQACP